MRKSAFEENATLGAGSRNIASWPTGSRASKTSTANGKPCRRTSERLSLCKIAGEGRTGVRTDKASGLLATRNRWAAILLGLGRRHASNRFL